MFICEVSELYFQHDWVLLIGMRYFLLIFVKHYCSTSGDPVSSNIILSENKRTFWELLHNFKSQVLKRWSWKGQSDILNSTSNTFARQHFHEPITAIFTQYFSIEKFLDVKCELPRDENVFLKTQILYSLCGLNS